MALSPNFSSTESISSPNLITFVDESTGVDATITERRIFCRLANGNYLTEGGVESATSAYTVWPYADASIEVDLIVQSTVANVTVNWVNVSGTTVVTKTTLMEWDLYDYLFLFGLLSTQTSFPAINDNQGYWPNTFAMITNLFQSESAVVYMDDLYSSAGALAANQQFINNENIYF